MGDANIAEAARFNRTFQRYAFYMKKSCRQVVDKVTLDVAFGALKETPRGNRAEITALPERKSSKYPGKKFWPIYIASRIAGKGFTIKTKRKGVKTEETIQGSFTRAQAKQVSAKILAARKRAIGYIASGWLAAIKFFWPKVKDKPFGRAAGVKQYGSPKGTAGSGGPEWSPYSIITNNANGCVKVGARALRVALIMERKDMAVYVARKMGEAARKVKNGV